MQSIAYFEADVPHCSLVYGVPPCGAKLAGDADPTAVTFDGVDDFLERAGGLTGAANSQLMTFSCWVRRRGSTIGGRLIAAVTALNGGTGASRIVLVSGTNVFNARGLNAAAATILDISASAAPSVEVWTNYLVSVDLSNAAKRHLYVNDVSDLVVTTYTNDTMDFTMADWGVGGYPDGTSLFEGDLADLWFAPGVYIDFSVEANRRKFVTADLSPVSLGATGNTPTGTAPLVFMSGTTWQTNKGTGGGFTLNGTLDETDFSTGTAKCFNSLGTCQARSTFTDEPVSLRFAEDVGFLPREIDAFPFIKAIDFTPATISLSGDLGQRATLKAQFRDARHSDAGDIFDKYPESRDYDDPWNRGTFWGKFRARNPYLRGRSCRVIRGLIPDTFAATYSIGDPLPDDILDQQETRYYVIESIDGPTPQGEFSIIAKDVLKIADNDRALAPALSNGFLVAGISAAALALTLSPAGIGDTDYPASGYATIGGKEVVTFTRVADVMTIVRAQLNTLAAIHDTSDRVQLMLRYVGEDPADILADLWDRAGADPDYIPIAAWQEETAAFLARVYTLNIAEPTGINKLISEMLEYMGAAQWWDDREQLIRLQILRAVSTTADRYNEDNIIEASLEVKEQPDKRKSRVIVYFGQVNPLKKLDDLENYRSSEQVYDAQSEEDEGTSSLKIIYARGIAAGGRAVATTLATKYLSRYVRAPRRFNFDLFRYAGQDPLLGGGYRLGGGTPFVESWPFQDETGSRVDIPIQLTRLDPDGTRYKAEAEEMLFTAFGEEIDPNDRVIIFDANEANIVGRTRHDELYPTPVSGNTVTFIVQAGVIISSTSETVAAFDLGSWPAGVIVLVRVSGRIQGCGGDAGAGGYPGTVGNPGQAGGTALYTRFAISLDLDSAEIWGGGGGGGGAGGYSTGTGIGGSGGGGGAGTLPGDGGPGGPTTNSGNPGTATTGGPGGPNGFHFEAGGVGGGPGLVGAPGSTGGNALENAGGAAGAAGKAIDGISYVTLATGSTSDIRGSQIN